MPLVKGGMKDSQERPIGRIENTGKLLFTAALIMAIALLSSSFLSTLLIPADLFKDGAEANGRALAYLAHKFLGEGFGSIYDISTILILWFAGASAMAGLLNLVPRYLPRYGMAPDWARAQRPLVLLFAFITFSVTWIFKADVDAQAGAYATGVLVLFTSAAFAVVLASWSEGWQKRTLFLSILIVFIYTSIANMIERPEGLHIASLFIATILITSLLSRALRSMELRVLNVSLDEKAASFVNEVLERTGQICLLAHRPGSNNFAAKEKETRAVHKLSPDEASFLFLEVNLSDPSEFTGQQLEVRGKEIDGIKILECDSPATPNAIAALLLHLRSMSKSIPCAYFGWTEGHPFTYIFKYIFLGEGETAPVTREILRKVEPDPDQRPKIIVG